MLRNYFQIAKRNLNRHYLYFIVNLMGLSLGIACCIVAYTNWEFHHEFDGQHVNASSIYKVNTVRRFEDQLQNYGVTPKPLAGFIKSEIAEVNDAVRYLNQEEVIKLGDKVIRQNVAYVDPEFLHIFTFPLTSGTSQSIEKINHAYITEEAASQFYGKENVIGKPLQLISAEGDKVELTIAGVLKDHPLNSSFQFNILLNMDTFYESHANVKSEEVDWGKFIHATFIYVKPRSGIASIENQLQNYLEPLNESREDWQAEQFYLVNLNNMANEARYIRGNYLGQNNPEGAIMIPIIMAIIILLVACFNFMNTSISMSGKRLKEIGVRKAVGATRKQLIFQLLSENVLLITFSLVLGIFFAELLIPMYSKLGPWIDLKINYAGNIPFFAFLIILLMITAILSGSYPAFYVSRFNTTHIFSGRFRLQGSSGLSKGLMALQLSFSLIALIQGIVYVQNTRLQKAFDLGYSKHGVITLPIEKGLEVNTYKEQIKSFSGISEAAVTRHHVGYNLSSVMSELGPVKKEVREFDVGENYMQTMQMDIIRGRYFEKDSKTDQEEAVVVNEQFIKDFSLDDPIDSRVLINEKPRRIIGVVKDFYPYGLWKDETYIPTILILADDTEMNFVVANVNGADLQTADEFMKSQWKQMYPDEPYESDRENLHVYRSELLSANMGVMNLFLAAIALFLSATGLFTLISINIQKRTKEIGLRRIMGASIGQIVGLINRGFVWVILISVVGGTLLGAYFTEMFLDIMFAIHAHVGVIAVGFTAILIVIIVLATSGFRVLQAASSNPVDSLKYE